MPILAVALDRFAASFTDGMLERGDTLLLRCRCASHMEDFLLQNRAVQVGHAVAERDLCEGQSQADPVRGQMVDIVEVNSAHGKIAKLFKGGHAFYVSKNAVGLSRLERERNKAGKTICLI